jgi:hypothetical protein
MATSLGSGTLAGTRGFVEGVGAGVELSEFLDFGSYRRSTIRCPALLSSVGFNLALEAGV